jgi:hypothetical protein
MTGQAMDEQALREGKERVREHLICWLGERGLKRRRAIPAEVHARHMDELVNLLAYLSADELMGLRDVVMRNAQGDLRNIWPDQVSVLNWAHALRRPPDRSSRLITTYLSSAAGVAAWNRSPYEAVILWRHLKEHGRPPVGDGAWRIIRETAEAAAHTVGLTRERLAAGRVVADRDRAEAEWFDRAQAHVKALVFPDARVAA